MDYPSLCFVDARGNELPWDGDTQYIRQYGGWWRVRVRGEWQGGVALVGEPPFPLIATVGAGEPRPYTDWELPKKMTDDEKKRVTSAGQVTAVLLHPSGNIVSASPQASLFVTPANITEQQLNQMIAEIGILALSTASCVTRQLSVPAGEGVGIGGVGLQWLPSSGHLATAAGASSSGSKTRLYCSCPKCGSFWVVQHCYLNHHQTLGLVRGSDGYPCQALYGKEFGPLT